jgi:hypothetical protein
MLLRLILLIAAALAATPVVAQVTIYTVVLGNQKYVVGSSTLHSGLYRSTDYGKNWEHLGPQNLKAYSMDAVDTSKGRILYIAAGNGVHKSTNFGKTWKIMTDWRMTEVMDVKVDQQDPRWVYAATAWGFWRSSDGGETWENPAGVVQQRYINELFVLNQLHAVSSDTVFGSDDHGTEWNLEELHTITMGNMKIYARAGYGNAIYLAGDSGVFSITPVQYRDFLQNGPPPNIDVTSNLPTRIVHSLAVAQNQLFAGTWGEGVYRREGDKWIPSGLEGSQVWRIVVKGY